MDMTFDLAAYLKRVGLAATPPPDLDGARTLHRAHVMAIPFENLDIQFGVGIKLDAASLQQKLVQRRRGGYCFEQNALFATALAAIGVAAEPREARVRTVSGALLPRTHMALVIAFEGRDWLADVGFGGDGLVEPLPLDGTPAEQEGRGYRAMAEGARRILQMRSGETWVDQYALLPDVVYPIDFEMANWFTSTWPRSPFVQTVTAQRVTAGARHILRNLTYTVTRGDVAETREISRAELVPLLRSIFDLDVPSESRFAALDGLSAALQETR